MSCVLRLSNIQKMLLKRERNGVMVKIILMNEMRSH
jgi:hypothetical protein